MKRRRGVVLLFAAVLLLASAFPAEDVNDLVRRGNAAIGRGDFSAAVDLFTRAEDLTTDPGLIAFNKAAALYRLAETAEDTLRRRGLFHEAELHYRRALEDAQGERRGRAFFDLGNALVQEAEDQDAHLLEQAIGSYKAALAEPEISPLLAAKARDNLELANILWQRAKANPNQGKPDSIDNPAFPRPDDRSQEGHPGEGLSPGDADPRGRGQYPFRNQTGKELQGGMNAAGQPAPGSGTLPPIPDESDLVALSPEDAERHLLRAADRIRRERRQHQEQHARPVLSNVKDW